MQHEEAEWVDKKCENKEESIWAGLRMGERPWEAEEDGRRGRRELWWIEWDKQRMRWADTVV